MTNIIFDFILPIFKIQFFKSVKGVLKDICIESYNKGEIDAIVGCPFKISEVEQRSSWVFLAGISKTVFAHL